MQVSKSWNKVKGGGVGAKGGLRRGTSTYTYMPHYMCPVLLHHSPVHSSACAPHAPSRRPCMAHPQGPCVMQPATPAVCIISCDVGDSSPLCPPHLSVWRLVFKNVAHTHRRVALRVHNHHVGVVNRSLKAGVRYTGDTEPQLSAAHRHWQRHALVAAAAAVAMCAPHI